jgi:hypothetical protein
MFVEATSFDAGTQQLQYFLSSGSACVGVGGFCG